MSIDPTPQLSTPATLQTHLATLTQIERHYHGAHAEASAERFDRLVAPEFWEIGASGRHYSRAFARSVLSGRTSPPDPSHWQDGGHLLSQVAADLFLLTYTLTQPGRTTRRMSLWRLGPDGWQVVFHQGTPCL